MGARSSNHYRRAVALAAVLAFTTIVIPTFGSKLDAAYPGYPGMCSSSDFDAGWIAFNDYPFGNDNATGWVDEYFDGLGGNCYDIQAVVQSNTATPYPTVSAQVWGYDTCDGVNWYGEINSYGAETYSASAVTPMYFDSYLDCQPGYQHEYDDYLEGIFTSGAGQWEVGGWTGAH